MSYTPTGAPKAALGTIKVESATSVSTAQRLVSFAEFRITESNFSTLPRDQARTVGRGDLARSLRPEDRVIALDRVLANLDKSQIIPKNVEGVKADPPPIFFSKTPAVLVNVDGDPIWSSIQGNDLQFAVNTNWDLFQHTPTKTLYLRATDTWLEGPGAAGPVDLRGAAARQLFQAAQRCELEGCEGCAARQEDRAERRAQGLRHDDASGTDSSEGRTLVRARRRHVQPALDFKH